MVPWNRGTMGPWSYGFSEIYRWSHGFVVLWFLGRPVGRRKKWDFEMQNIEFISQNSNGEVLFENENDFLELTKMIF